MSSEQTTSQIEVVKQQPEPKKKNLEIMKKQDVSNSKMLELPTTQDFALLDSEYNKSKDFKSLYERRFSTEYLMIRSFKKENLQELLTKYNIPFNKKDKLDVKKQNVFEHIEKSQIIEYLLNNKKYMDHSQIVILTNELKKICQEKCCVHNDYFSGNLNRIIRNPDTYTLKMLESQIDNLKKQLESYAKWQWYNQKCSDLNENIIKMQENIIPTLRPIAKIDFFSQIEDIVFPFDLKTTIFPKNYKKDISTEAISEFIKNEKEHFDLLKWLYQEQNPRLFCNNYRYFIILIDINNINNSRNLKCETDLINKKVSKYFSQINKTNIIDIEYSYKKDKSLSGFYKTKCLYTLVYQ